MIFALPGQLILIDSTVRQIKFYRVLYEFLRLPVFFLIKKKAESLGIF